MDRNVLAGDIEVVDVDRCELRRRALRRLALLSNV